MIYRSNLNRDWIFPVPVLFFILLFSSGCKQEPTLFRLLGPDESGIAFSNDIFEDDQYNILKVSYLYNGGGVSVADFNNDSLPDIFFTGNMVDNQLYLNQGELKFRDVTEAAGVAEAGKWMYGSAVVDINGDGWRDIYVCASIAGGEEARRNALFVNQGLNEEGVPVFEDQAKAYGLDDTGYSSQAAFLDYDRDGDLDLFVLSNSKVEGIPSKYRRKLNDGSSDNTDKLYRNNGDGTFTDVSYEMGIRKEGFGLGIAVTDVNQDGYPDLYIGNDYITNDLLYVNDSGRFFHDQIDEVIKHQSRFSMGNDAADINNDGHPEVITLDMLPETNLRKKTVIVGNGYIVYINDFKYGYTHQYVRNMLQLNHGNMDFSEIGQLAGVHQTEWSWSPLFADFDNDGFRDLLITNGFPRDITDNDFISFRKESGAFTTIEQLMEEVPSVKIPNYAFRNEGDLTFSDVSADWGFTQPSFSNGAAFADFDRDGDLDYVVNNINDPAFLYENTLYDREELKPGNYLRIKLIGPQDNSQALGTKVRIFYAGGKSQYHDHNIYRGYVSTVEEIVHFGLGAALQVDSLVVTWPDGKQTHQNNIAANQTLSLAYTDAGPAIAEPVSSPQLLVEEASVRTGLDHLHQEDDYIDYNVQRNIPHKFSQSGPSLAVGDVNGDQLDDLFVGGSRGFTGSIYLQGKDGTFRPMPLDTAHNVLPEDLGSLFFDADNDGDQDLYLVSGSFEYPEGSEYLQDRLLLNDGRGRFAFAPEALPVVQASGSCVKAADYDADGDLDLFVGGRVVVGSYPRTPRSYLLRNEGGKFQDVTASLSPELAELGMITDALWSDFNGDGAVDLIVVGEFLPIGFFANEGGKLVKQEDTGLGHLSGWWNSIIAGDFDRDGDMDYVAGNVGENNYFCATVDQPVRATANDFDGNGALDVVLSCYFKAEDGSMQPFPVHSWAELNAQSPLFRNRFDHYYEYGRTTIDSLFTPQELEGAIVLEANYMASSYVENLGEGKFALHKLPIQAQFAPANGLLAMDVNGDMYLDLIMVGNDYGNEVNMGQYDAFRGLILLGDGQGGFQAQMPRESGFSVRGDAKALCRITGASGQELIVASQNRGPLRTFQLPTNKTKSLVPGPLDFSVKLYYQDGSVQSRELSYGAGYLSQSSRQIAVGESVVKVELTDFAGNTREESFEQLP
jgi:hypothetical protein